MLSALLPFLDMKQQVPLSFMLNKHSPGKAQSKKLHFQPTFLPPCQPFIPVIFTGLQRDFGFPVRFLSFRELIMTWDVRNGLCCGAALMHVLLL